MKLSNFSTAMQRSPLAEAQWIGQVDSPVKKKKSHSAVLLPLTSLIDAFSIIVIYLLIGTQAGGLDMDLPTQVKLPAAESGQIIEAKMPIIRIQNGEYYLENKKIAVADLATNLAQLKSKSSSEGVEILIQADQAMNYQDLDPLLRAGSQAGIQKLKFAVTPGK